MSQINPIESIKGWSDNQDPARFVCSAYSPENHGTESEVWWASSWPGHLKNFRLGCSVLLVETVIVIGVVVEVINIMKLGKYINLNWGKIFEMQNRARNKTFGLEELTKYKLVFIIYNNKKYKFEIRDRWTFFYIYNGK